MNIKTFTVNPFQMNSYLYYCENSLEGVIIDPGYYTKYEQDDIIEYVNNNKINIKYILCTHGHIDHVLGNGFTNDSFKAKTYIHKDDLFLYNNAVLQGEYYGLNIQSLPVIDNFINDGNDFTIGDNILGCIHTPGHSPGGICLIDPKERIIFSGDLVFKSSIGRTDLPGGNYDTLLDSIQNRLFTICSDDYEIYPGHMGKTTVGFEKTNNPFLKE